MLFAISVLTFLIFTGDPTHPELLAGGTLPDPGDARAHPPQWGFDRPVYIRYLQIMKLIFTGQIISYTQQVNVVHQIWRVLAGHAVAGVGAGVIWLSMGVLFGLLSAWRAAAGSIAG